MSKKKNKKKKRIEFFYRGEYYRKIKETGDQKDSEKSTTLKKDTENCKFLVQKLFYTESASFLDLIYGKMHLYGRHIRNGFYVPSMTLKTILAQKYDPSIREIATEYFGMCYKDWKKMVSENDEKRVSLMTTASEEAAPFDIFMDICNRKFATEESAIRSLKVINKIVSEFQQIPIRNRKSNIDLINKLIDDNPFHMTNIYAADIPLLSASVITDAIPSDHVRLPGFTLIHGCLVYVEINLFLDHEVVMFANATSLYKEDGVWEPIPHSNFSPFDQIREYTDMPLVASDIITLIPDNLGFIDLIERISDSDSFTEIEKFHGYESNEKRIDTVSQYGITTHAGNKNERLPDVLKYYYFNSSYNNMNRAYRNNLS